MDYSDLGAAYFEEAEKQLALAKAKFEQGGIIWGVALAQVALGDLSWARGDRAAALENYSQAAARYAASNIRERLAEVRSKIAQLH